MTERSTWLIDQLPMGMLDDDFFVRFVGIFQELADTHKLNADSIEHAIDLAVAPPEMVRFLGTWIGVHAIDPSLPDDFQRRAVRAVGQMLPWRGTRKALLDLLELVTGEPAEVIDPGGVYREGQAPPNHKHVVIRVRTTGWVTETDLRALVAADMPADVTFELQIDPQPDRTPVAVGGEQGS
ncbi:MAG TPA: phage tail protein [Acidimicrobiales bacterium]|nr:phage tail protein [Acidimicrobiales bacterium]